jgi:hypothetical protein
VEQNAVWGEADHPLLRSVWQEDPFYEERAETSYSNSGFFFGKGLDKASFSFHYINHVSYNEIYAI